MQFPKGRKERIQIVVLALIAAAAALFGFMTFVVQPFRASYAACLNEMASIKTKLDDANTEIGKGKNAKEKCEKMRAALREFDGAHVLQAEYGNYNIKADEYIKNTFAMPGLNLEALPPGGQFFDIPRAQGNKLMSFVVSVSCTITGRRGYEHLLDLFRKIETDNPYVSISKINMTAAQPGSMSQPVSFVISWPIWKDPAIVTTFMPQAKQSDNSTNATSAAANRKESRR